MTTDLKQLCAEALAVDNRATRGPWHWGDPDKDENRFRVYSYAIDDDGDRMRCMPVLWIDAQAATVMANDDCQAVTEFRNLVPRLARGCMEVIAENERLKAALREACGLLTDYTLLPGDSARAAEFAKLAEKRNG